MGISRRRLSFSEEGFASFPTTTSVGAVTVRGALDLGLLREAFGALRQEHPALAGRIEPASDGFDLVVGGLAAPAADVFRSVAAGPDDEPVLVPRLDVGATLSAVAVSSSGDRHTVSLGINHAIADGGGVLFHILRLWEHYTFLVEHGPIGDLPVWPAPRPPQHVLAERGVERGSSTGEERLSGAVWSGRMPSSEDLPDGPLSLMRGRVRFDRETSEGLRRKAQSEGLTLHGLVAGIIVAAEREAFADAPDDHDILLGLMSLVDARSRIGPPVGPVEVTNFVGASYFSAKTRAGADHLALGRGVQDQLREDLATGLCLQPMLRPPGSSAPDHEPPIVLSNLGVIPDFTLPEALAQEDAHGFIEVDLGDWRPDWVLAERLPAPSASIYQLSTFNGQLSVNMSNAPGSIPIASRDHVLRRIAESVRGEAGA